MKKLFLFFTIISISNYAYSQSENSENLILQKVDEKLKTIDAISFNQTRELNYASENYNNISDWNCYYVKDSKENLLGFKFQIQTPDYSDFFNGTEYFSLNQQDKTYEVENETDIESFNTKSYLYNSVLTLANILPTLIKDENSEKTVSDTLIDGKQFKNIKINLGKRSFKNSGKGFDQAKTERDFIYNLLIDAETFLPKEILQTNNQNSDFIKVSFSNYNLNPPKPKENSWFYSTYRNEYQPFEEKTLIQLAIGEKAPNWKLDLLNKDENIDLEQLKGKVVLLDFWIKNCGACIESVDFLNKIYEKYKDKNFELLGINSYDTTENINFFYEKHGLKYPVLINGKTILEKYGVNAFPTIFLLNKEGKIIYSDIINADRSQIETIIDSALEE